MSRATEAICRRRTPLVLFLLSVAVETVLCGSGSPQAGVDADVDWPRLQREWRRKEIAPEVLSLAEAVLGQFPLAQQPNMWQQLGPAYAVMARDALNRQDSAQIKELAATVEQHAAAHDFPGPNAPRNFLRGCYLEVVAAEEGAGRAAELFDGYHAAEGARLWRGRPVPRFIGTAARALADSGRKEDAEQVLMEALLTSPAWLHETLLPHFNYYRRAGDADRTLSIARAGFALCAYAYEPIARWSERVMQAFMGQFEPGNASAFAKAQTDPETANPLADVPMLHLTEEQRKLLFDSAGTNAVALVHAHLLLGQWDQAMEAAGKRLSRASGGKMDDAVRLVAVCFKAKDLNLIRANQFIEYSRTGEGENPVATF